MAINAFPVVPGMTGIGGYTRDLVASTIRHGEPHSYLYLIGPNGPKLSLDGRKGLRQLVVESPSRLWEQLNLPTELSSREVHLYHSPLFTCPIVREVPSVITIHDVIPESRPDLCSPAFLRFYRSCIGPATRAAEWILTTSEFSRQETVRHLGVPEDRVHVAYQGISEDRFSPENQTRVPALREKLELPDKYVLYVGMLDRRKNVERLIAAFGKVARDLTDVQLVIAGRKDESGFSIDSAIQATGAQDRVLRVGYVSDDDLPVLYAGAHVFAFVSLGEGFGRPIVEAMASGVPVVTSNSSSLPEIAGEAALLVDPEDVNEIAEALRRLCKDEKFRTSLSERGLVRSREFTHRKFGERLVEFYDMVEATL